METVIDVLKATGKATSRDIAARMKIEPVEVLAMLREHEELEQVVNINGYWTLLVPFTPEVKPEAVVIPKPVLRAKNLPKASTPRRPERLDPDAEFEKISGLLHEQGYMTAADIGKALERDARGMTATLRVLEKQGRLVKNGVGKGVTWSQASHADDSTFQAAEEPDQTKEFLLSIPALIKPPGELRIPTLAQIANEIRQVKTKLNRLEKLRCTIRELSKHKKIIQQFLGQ
ncbi:hypothetical protein AB3X34_07515 [Raoultella terrigena]|uniref:hypothetical protein n=1 Tax=Raoultella terrigena TaxID=577 RepID=UPI00349F1A1E